jgi:hypothetical protein
MRAILPFLLFLAAVLGAGHAQTPEPAGKIRVLIVDGFSNHDWRQTTALLRGILAPPGRFEVSVSTAPEKATDPGWDQWRPKFSDYDVVIQTCNDIGGGPMWPEAVKKDFVDFVRDGGGVYIYHGAQNAFEGWKEYEDIAALCWRDKNYGTAIRIGDDGGLIRIPPGEGDGTNHGARIDGLITRRGDDPIHAGLPRAWMTPSLEVYRYARGPAGNIEILSFARDAGSSVAWPVEWTTRYGKGRAYVSTFGHVWKGDVQPVSMRCAAVQTIIPRALEWLASRPVDTTVPADFPTDKADSIRPEIATPPGK